MGAPPRGAAGQVVRVRVPKGTAALLAMYLRRPTAARFAVSRASGIPAKLASSGA